MRGKIFFITIGMLFSVLANALSSDLKQKYPYTVLTNDYGILNETDLNGDLDIVFPAKKFPNGRLFSLYWQCFPRNDVRISLRDIGYSSYDIDDNDSELTIEAYTKSATHQYGMRRNWPVMSNEDRFNQYQKLMRGQKYICLQGTYFFYKDVITNEKKERVYFWTFEKMKSMKGCESYFQGRCHEKRIKLKR